MLFVIEAEERKFKLVSRIPTAVCLTNNKYDDQLFFRNKRLQDT